MLPHYFMPIVDNGGLHVLMVGRKQSKAVQRSVFVSPSGSVKFEVHGKEYRGNEVLRGVPIEKPLSNENLGYFCDRIVKIVSNLRMLEICAGMNKEEFKEAWPVTAGGFIDNDTFKECRYIETFRSKKCSLLVEAKRWRCKDCIKLQPYLKRKLEALKTEEPHQNTNTRFLSDKQKNARLAQKQKTIKHQSLIIDRLQARMKQLIAQEGVKVEESLYKDLTEVLQSGDLSPVQSLFLQQQLKAINCKKSCGMRWHPTLIRLALSIYLKSPSAYNELQKVFEPEIATKVMAFMVRGVSSKVKDVIASYPVLNPSPKQIYLWTWDVIGALERSGIRVIALICDGAPTNRSFIKLHQPITEVHSGVILDTVNKHAPHRPLFFFSDVPHLIKTIRNALYNSRLKKKGTRFLKKNGEPLTSELVEFLSRTNDWFDLLNGAFSSQGVRTNNRRLDPYTQKDIDDFENNVPSSRFKELYGYLDYLTEWREEVAMKKQQAAEMSMMSDLGVEALDGESSFHALEESRHEGEVEGSKNLLPHQTQLGIEMSTRAFMGTVTYLIKHGVTFINARVFQQDPLEQNFGKQRMAGGGSNNPNVAQYFFKQRNISTIGQLAAAKRKSAGNTEVVDEGTDNGINAEPLLKRECKRNFHLGQQ
ncbi:hypothetical protein ONE63_007300 [Megalurothrips usitatus]|uniref:Transposable element P transposase-like RNase H domain-containing protein n=1 Tax=Megalurothrips usitatus TaxID=439358 RepID=A0AAV7XRN0_9NEOP|nr:hypothetical protein ONE63_007300 [Megalurothrips usitatus]